MRLSIRKTDNLDRCIRFSLLIDSGRTQPFGTARDLDGLISETSASGVCSRYPHIYLVHGVCPPPLACERMRMVYKGWGLSLGRRIVRVKFALIAAFTLAVPAIVSAHHSATIFDRQTVVAFQGTVTQFTWANPHVYIHVETQDSAGEVVEWEIETDATPILTRSGWTRDTFVPGEQVSVRLNPDRNVERNHGLLMSISKSDGSTYSARSYFLRDPDDAESLARASDISGIWELSVDHFEPYYEAWAQVPLTEKGLAALESYDIRTENPSLQCIAPPTPTMLVGPYLNEIEIRDDVILIRNERFNIERTVYMDGRGHPEDGERTNDGHSIGWWEDDVLVIDTASFAENRSPFFGRPARAEGVPSGLDKHVVERISLSEDGTYLDIDFVLEDPEYLAEPFAATVRWYYAPHFEYLGFDCDPENARRFSGQ